MATKTRNGNGNIQSAIALLIQNQAQFLAQLTDTNRRLGQSDERFARIEQDLDLIKAILIRHEEILEKLPEAIREKIGFKSS